MHWLVMILVLIGAVNSHTYHFGRCPHVRFKANFDMDRMLGVWYVIQKTTTSSYCLTYKFTPAFERNKYKIEQISRHHLMGIKYLKQDFSYTGVLSVPDPRFPSFMSVRFPLSLWGSASYVVMSTDYITYALIFTCQNFVFVHRRSATILSRTTELNKWIVTALRSRLSAFNVDASDLTTMSHASCPKNREAETTEAARPYASEENIRDDLNVKQKHESAALAWHNWRYENDELFRNLMFEMDESDQTTEDGKDIVEFSPGYATVKFPI